MKLMLVRLVALAMALPLCVMAIDAWLSSRSQERQLQALVVEKQKIIMSADKRESDRNDSVKKAVAGIDKLKKRTQTTSQALKELPIYLPLPQPIVTGSQSRFSYRAAPTTQSLITNFGSGNLRLGFKAFSDHVAGSMQPQAENNGLQGGRPPIAVPDIQIPAPDIKPLFNYVQDCRACETELKAARENASDDATKLQTLIRERDFLVATLRRGAPPGSDSATTSSGLPVGYLVD